MIMDGEQTGDEEALVVAWIAANMGGEVTAARRQARWRPAWFVDVRLGSGAVLQLYVRGERTDMAPIFPLEHEWHIQELLYANEIPVPRVYGFCDNPNAIVMNAIPT